MKKQIVNLFLTFMLLFSLPACSMARANACGSCNNGQYIYKSTSYSYEDVYPSVKRNCIHHSHGYDYKQEKISRKKYVCNNCGDSYTVTTSTGTYTWRCSGY